MTQKRRQNYMARCDVIFGRIVRAPGVCVECGRTQFIQCAHGFSRRYLPTRTDFRNAFPLCRRCHVFYTHRPLEWDNWLRNRWGDEEYAELRALSLSGTRVDWKQRLGELHELEKIVA